MISDEAGIILALRQAAKAEEKGEIPIGAVIFLNEKVLATGYNLKESRHDPTAHAEIIAIQKACRKLGNWRLADCTLYVTLEPCPMCLSAIVQSRVSRLVFGAFDPIMGACGSKVDLGKAHSANPTIEVRGGVLEGPCREVIDTFWQRRRSQSGKIPNGK